MTKSPTTKTFTTPTQKDRFIRLQSSLATILAKSYIGFVSPMSDTTEKPKPRKEGSMYPDVEHLALDISRHQGEFSPAHAKLRGFDVIIGRCNIGYAPRDPRYIENKVKTERIGMPWLAYSVNWPINGQPAREALTAASLITSSETPLPPALVIADIELGVFGDDSPHHALPGDELYDINKEYALTLQKAVSPIETLIYTAPGYWNSPKLNPHIDGYELGFRLWGAFYPFNNQPGTAINPYDINPHVTPRIPDPWPLDQLFAWQWTSKGLGRRYQISDSLNVDQNVIYSEILTAPPPPPPPPPPSDFDNRIFDLETWRRRVADVT